MKKVSTIFIIFLLALGVLSLKASRIEAKPRSSVSLYSVKATATPTPTASPSNGQITKKVLVLDFDPLINGTTPLHTYKGWNDPLVL